MAIDLGKYGIRIDGSDLKEKDARESFEYRVRWLVLHIAESVSGRGLLELIGKTNKQILIQPYTAEVASSSGAGACNAFAQPRNFVHAIRRGEWEHNVDDPATPRDERFDFVLKNDPLRRLLRLPQEPVTGTGQGTNVDVRFSPQMWGRAGMCATPGAPGSSALQVLFHEVVHAYRQMRGMMHSVPTVGGRKGYDNEEEFVAIVVTNIYISDPTNKFGPRALRADHQWGFAPLSAARSTSAGFLVEEGNRRLVKKLVENEPELSAALRGAGGFNPIAEYLSGR